MRRTARQTVWREKVLFTDELKVEGQYCVQLYWSNQTKQSG